MTDDTPYDDDILAITERALERVAAFREPYGGESEQAMWVQVAGTARGDYTCRISLRPLADARAGDAVQRFGDLTVVVPRDDCYRLRGATVDWTGDATGGGLTVLNPNKPPPAPVGLPMSGSPAPPASPAIGDRPPADLTGPLERRVIQVLEQQVNPSIAQHGGRADLVAIEDATAYLRLGGGCQGCGMATVTLTQGISVAITEALPEIDRVVDVTDHSSGANPYYEQAKK
ncbi:MAG: NifU family protein [Solirubrobacterales bacterium]|nr:NifU family protein [Solirubrobacterales bacterium]